MNKKPILWRDFFTKPSRWLDRLLIIFPIALVLTFARQSVGPIFITAAICIVPLAALEIPSFTAMTRRAQRRE